MNTERNQTSTQSNLARPPALPASRPADPARLKAERVQLRFEPGAQPLSPERLQEALGRMPAWRLAPSGKALARVRQLPDAASAAAYAGFLFHIAVHAGQPLAIELAGSRLTATVRGRLHRGRRTGLTQETLDFAQSLE